MILLSLHCRNSEALRCSVLQTGSVVYGSLSITSFESVINQSELCVQILDACLTHARKHHRDPCRLSFTQRACSQANRQRLPSTKGHVTRCNFSCNLQCNSTLERCKIAKYESSLQSADVFSTYRKFFTDFTN